MPMNAIRLWTAFVFIGGLPYAARCQAPITDPECPVRIKILVLEANGLSPAERQHIVRAFEGKTYPRNEISYALRQMLRRMGYQGPTIEAPLILPLARQGDATKVVIGVNARSRTRLKDGRPANRYVNSRIVDKPNRASQLGGLPGKRPAQ